MKIYRHKTKDDGAITFIWKDDKFYIITIFGTIISNTIYCNDGLYVFQDMFNNKRFEIYTQNIPEPVTETSDQLFSDSYSISWWIDDLTEFHKMFDEYFFGP